MTCRCSIEDKREPLCGSAFRPGIQRNTTEKSLLDEPMEQPTDRAQQMVIASRTLAWTRKEECIQQFRSDLFHSANVFLNQVSVQNVKDILLGMKAAADCTLVSEILFHSFAQDALENRVRAHCRTSSPSPQATSRRDSMATLL